MLTLLNQSGASKLENPGCSLTRSAKAINWVCTQRTRRKPSPGLYRWPRALAIEIVSPESVARDYVQKRTIYEQAGVREYWIIDPDERRTTFLSLREGGYVEVSPVEHVFRSEVLPGFHLDVRWLWAVPRPLAYDVLRQLLSGRRKQE